jgi:hypothetical protein
MDKMLKNQIVENMQWLSDQKGKRVLIFDHCRHQREITTVILLEKVALNLP